MKSGSLQTNFHSRPPLPVYPHQSPQSAYSHALYVRPDALRRQPHPVPSDHRLLPHQPPYVSTNPNDSRLLPHQVPPYYPVAHPPIMPQYRHLHTTLVGLEAASRKRIEDSQQLQAYLAYILASQAVYSSTVGGINSYWT